MRKVFQTRYGDPDGNCWEACIASIREFTGDFNTPIGHMAKNWETLE